MVYSVTMKVPCMHIAKNEDEADPVIPPHSTIVFFHCALPPGANDTVEEPLTSQ